MNLQSFAQRFFSQIDFFAQHTVLCFAGSGEYPHFLFDRLFSYMRKRGQAAIETIDCNDEESVLIQSRLQTTFLGDPHTFQLLSLEQVKDSQCVAFLSSYQGPHKLIFFLPEDLLKQRYAKNRWEAIPITSTISRADIQSWYPLFADDMTKQVFDFFVQKLFERYGTLSLEKICLLLPYATLIGSKNSDLFLQAVADRIIESTQSLFALAQDFFGQKATTFFKKWQAIEDHYPEQFWISYWSNQLFRAHLFVHYMKKKQPTDAKTISARQLPFSFIERDWRKYNDNHMLVHAHQKLVALDSRLKTTGYPYPFDIFFSRFFNASISI